MNDHKDYNYSDMTDYIVCISYFNYDNTEYSVWSYPTC